MAEKVEIKIIVDKDTGAFNVAGQELKGFASATEAAERRMTLAQIEANKMNEAFTASQGATMGLGAAMTGLLAAGGFIEFLRLAVDESMHESEALRVLKGSVESTGASWGRYKDIIIEFAQQQQELTRFQDGETYEVLGKLARATNNVAQAMRATQLAQDLAVKTGKSLSETTDTVSNLLLGQERAVKQANREYGNLAGAATSAQQALDNLQRATRGAAAAEESGAKSVAQLKAAWGDTIQIVGDAVVPILADVATAIRDVLKATQEHLGFVERQKNASAERVVSLTQERDALIAQAASLSTHAAQTAEVTDEEKKLTQAIKDKNLELAAAQEIQAKDTGGKGDSAGDLKARADVEAAQRAAEKRKEIEDKLADEANKRINDEADYKRLKLEEEIAAAEEAGVKKITISEEGVSRDISLQEYKRDRTYQIADEQLQKSFEVDQKRVEQQKKTEKQIEEIEKQRKQNFQSTLEFISTLSTSKNKELALIGKAAGLANAYINTGVAVTRALAAAPPPFNFALAAAVGAAGAAQIATIAGVQLARGGVTDGSGTEGILAQIGEKRRKEAVLPLENPKAMEMVGQAISEAGGAGGGGPQVSVSFGDINVTVQVNDITDPAALKQVAIGLADLILAEVDEAVVLSRRAGDANVKFSERAV